MSYFHVAQLAKAVGFKDSDTLFYAVPGHSLEATIDKLTDETCVSEMLKYADQTIFLEIYIKALFSSKKFSQKVLQYPSHRILRYVHGALNVDEKTKCTVWLKIARRTF